MPDANEVPALTATGLSCRFRRPWRPGRWAECVVWALRECAFTLPAGRVAALVGPNGAGKSTLVVYVAVVTGLASAARVHYAPPVQHVERFTTMPSYPLGDGWRIEEGFLNEDGERVEDSYHECINRQARRMMREGQVFDGLEPLEMCFREAGAVEYLLIYHPAGRYWRFQATEAGLIGLVSLSVLSSAALAVRRRLW